MDAGVKVVNEFNDYQPVYYCGNCLDTSTGLEDIPAGDVHQCVYCGTDVCCWEDFDVTTNDEPDTGSVQYAPGFVFVNVYEIDRAYGGPEEGGWWYDCGTLILSRQVPESDAESVAEQLRVKYPKRTRSDVYSVLYDGGAYRVWVEDQPGADYPTTTPHYE